MGAIGANAVGVKVLAVGYIGIRVDSCPLCSEPHEHVMRGDVPVCEREVRWCSGCGVPLMKSDAECYGCEHLKKGA